MGYAMINKPTDNDKWHMDRGVPVTLVVSMVILFLGQTVTAAWWVSKLDARVDILEVARVTTAPQADRLTRVEVKVENIQLGITEIKDLIRSNTASFRNKDQN